MCCVSIYSAVFLFFFFFQAEDGIRDKLVTGVQTCALPISGSLVEDRALRVRLARDGGRGKEAITRYRVLERARGATVLELVLVTGRRGQLRAQLAALGHPIVGDRAYGSRRDPLRRVCLHATRLGFVHPSGRRVGFESPPPAGFRRAWRGERTTAG